MNKKLKNLYKIQITGKNTYSLISKLSKDKIEIIEINYKNINEIYITINKKDLKKIQKYKYRYQIKIIEKYGKEYFKENISQKKFMIILIIISLIVIKTLSNIIFKIEIITNDNKLKEILIEELEKYEIKKYKFKKNYKQILKIKKQILEDYKDKLEWIEIIPYGTKYVVKFEERILPNKKEELKPSNIVATNYGIVKNIEATSGTIVVTKNTYVKPGDILISSEIKLNDELKSLVKSTGTVYGEVWYQSTVEYPLKYKEEQKTGKHKKVFTIKILNKEFEISFKHYKNKKTKTIFSLKNNLIPFSFNYEYEEEINKIEETYTKEEAVNKAINKVKEKISQTLSEKEQLIDIKKLKVEENNSRIIVEVFITVYKKISEEKLIESNEVN